MLAWVTELVVLSRVFAGPPDAQLLPLPSLTWLDLSRNRLAAAPPALAACTALVHLALGGNALSALPPELSRLRGLEKIDLRKNALEQVRGHRILWQPQGTPAQCQPAEAAGSNLSN